LTGHFTLSTEPVYLPLKNLLFDNYLGYPKIVLKQSKGKNKISRCCLIMLGSWYNVYHGISYFQNKIGTEIFNGCGDIDEDVISALSPSHPQPIFHFAPSSPLIPFRNRSHGCIQHQHSITTMGIPTAQMRNWGHVTLVSFLTQRNKLQPNRLDI